MTRLATWLATRTVAQLTALIADRSRTFYGGAPKTLEELARQLRNPSSVAHGLMSLTTAELQVLRAAVHLATDEATSVAASRSQFQPLAGDSHQAVEPLLRALGAASGPRRTAALEVLADLQDQVLIESGSGDDDIVIPGSVVGQLSRRGVGAARPLDRALAAGFNKAALVTIAETLGVGHGANLRPALQAAIVAHLSDGDRVRALFETAPPRARQLLSSMMDDTGLLGTRVFPAETINPAAKHLIDTGYTDGDTVWLATRALIVPTGPAVAEVPAEVLQALRDGAAFTFVPRPPALPGVAVVPDRVRGEAQLALTGAVSNVAKLLEALDQQPVVPRRSGGFPVRETRRLATLLGQEEIEAIFWVGLATAAGLIGEVKQGSWYAVCPTAAADAWLASPVPQRLARLLRSWLELHDLMTWWPIVDETPVAYNAANDPYAATVRLACLRSLATLPPGTGVVHVGPTVAAGGLSRPVDDQLVELTRSVIWFAPMLPGQLQLPNYLRHQVYEAELLGVAAYGALTDVGHALIAGDDPALLEALAAILPAEQVTARFQADMTVVVTGTPVAELAALLGSVADRESEGHAVVYRVTPASVRRALDGGADPAELLARLAEVSDGPLPQPLTYLIAEAGRRHGRVRVLAAGCCLRCDDESLVAEIVQTRKLSALELRQIAPTVLVSVKPPTETLAALRAAGFAPALEARTGTTVVERVPGRRARVPTQRGPVGGDLAGAAKLAQRLLGRAQAEPDRPSRPGRRASTKDR